MIANSPTITVPLQTDQDGVIRISGSRVTLDTIINYYLQGETPEDLHEGFSTISLTDIYAVIAYYLSHRVEVDAYLTRQREIEARIRQKAETHATSQQQAFDERMRLAKASRKQ